MRRVIFTGDDFGIAVPVNEAIVEAHRQGVLTTASLMVNADAAQDAVERAHQNPSLRVGLHLVLVEGRPILPRNQIPCLTNAKGELSTRLVRSGFSFFFRPEVRNQLEAEIRAQFEAFSRTGLDLDHVNAHNHMHLHPTVLSLILSVGRDFGLKAVRLPYEPPLRAWRAARRSLATRVLMSVFLAPWTVLMKYRLTRARIKTNDYVFGMGDSGSMTSELLSRLLRVLPDGTTEIYFHPATRRCPEIDRTMPHYRHEEEYRALIAPRLPEALVLARIEKVAFCDL